MCLNRVIKNKGNKQYVDMLSTFKIILIVLGVLGLGFLLLYYFFICKCSDKVTIIFFVPSKSNNLICLAGTGSEK